MPVYLRFKLNENACVVCKNSYPASNVIRVQYTSEFLTMIKMQNICENSFKPTQAAMQSLALKIKHPLKEELSED